MVCTVLLAGGWQKPVDGVRDKTGNKLMQVHQGHGGRRRWGEGGADQSTNVCTSLKVLGHIGEMGERYKV